jgi:hypothetical protein
MDYLRLFALNDSSQVTHGKGLMNDLSLGYLLDQHADADCRSGTFGQLLRDGTIYLEQTREHIRLATPERPATTLKKGLLEP